MCVKWLREIIRVGQKYVKHTYKGVVHLSFIFFDFLASGLLFK